MNAEISPFELIGCLVVLGLFLWAVSWLLAALKEFRADIKYDIKIKEHELEVAPEEKEPEPDSPRTKKEIKGDIRQLRSFSVVAVIGVVAIIALMVLAIRCISAD